MIPLRVKFSLNVFLTGLLTAVALVAVVGLWVPTTQTDRANREGVTAQALVQGNASLLDLAASHAPGAANLLDVLLKNPSLAFNEEGAVVPIAADGTYDTAAAWSWDGLDKSPQVTCVLGARGQRDPGYDQPQATLCGDTWVGSALVSGTEGGPRWLMISWVTQSTLLVVPSMPVGIVPVLILVAVAMVTLTTLVTWRSSRPMGRVANSAVRVADRFARGDVTARMSTASDDELGVVATAFNAAADRLVDSLTEAEESAGRQRRLLSDAAHELRTPTAALLASATALEDPATRDAAAVQVAPQLRRLSALTEDLLELSRLDAGRAPVSTDDVDLRDLVAEVAVEAGPEVTVSGASVSVRTDPVRVRAIVTNLVGNALRHGRPPVSIGVLPVSTGAIVAVSDAGDGVPPGDREQVFERFYRADASRHGGGAGLGLAIARENARLLGGELTLDDDGRTFRLRLPSGL